MNFQRTLSELYCSSSSSSVHNVEESSSWSFNLFLVCSSSLLRDWFSFVAFASFVFSSVTAMWLKKRSNLWEPSLRLTLSFNITVTEFLGRLTYLSISLLLDRGQFLHPSQMEKAVFVFVFVLFFRFFRRFFLGSPISSFVLFALRH